MDDHVPSQNVEVITTRKAGNVCSRLCHCLMIFPLLAVAVLASVSLAFFVVKRNEIAAKTPHCILYATYNQGETVGSIDYGDDTGCEMAIWGEVSLIVLGVFLLIWMVIKAVAGVHVLNMLVFIDLFGFGAGLVGSLGFALDITIGLTQTCNALGQDPLETGSCSNFVFPPLIGVKFYDSLHTSEVTAWLAAGVLFLMFVVYIFLTITFCCRCGRREQGPQYSSFHDAATLRQSKKNPFNNYGTTGTATEPTNPFNDS